MNRIHDMGPKKAYKKGPTESLWTVLSFKQFGPLHTLLLRLPPLGSDLSSHMISALL